MKTIKQKHAIGEEQTEDDKRAEKGVPKLIKTILDECRTKDQSWLIECLTFVAQKEYTRGYDKADVLWRRRLKASDIDPGKITKINKTQNALKKGE